MRRAPITASAILLAVLVCGVLGFVGVASSLLLGSAPLVGGLLLGAGGVLAGWAGWKFGLARRPRPAMIPVAVVEPRRRSTRP